MNLHTYAALESRIGYCFGNKLLLREALTHASHTNEFPGDPNYERLEFLGDAVIELIITRQLYERHREWGEGRMTRTRAMVVSQPSLSQVALEIGLDKYIRMGKGALKGNGRARPSVLCDVFEAVLGAIYLDGGLEAAAKVALPLLKERILAAEEQGISIMDHKTILQEQLQKSGDVSIEYVLIDTQGPPHDRRFIIELRVEDKPMAVGEGTSKKAAQQEAARKALEALAAEEPDET